MLRRTIFRRAPAGVTGAFSEYIMRPPTNVGIVVVPQGTEYVVERLGKFSRTLLPGLHVLVPVLDKIRYAYSKKEMSIMLNAQHAVTRDNVMLTVDSVLFAKITDCEKASYNIDSPVNALVNLAQTTLRSEVGKLSLDHVFAEREALNSNIVNALMVHAGDKWGIEPTRFELRGVEASESVRVAMDMQAAAERQRRREVLLSEGQMQAQINEAQGAAEAQLVRAKAEAESLQVSTKAVVDSLKQLSSSMEQKGAHDAVSFRLAEQYISAFSHIAKEGNTVVLSQNMNDPASVVAQGSSIFKALTSGAGAAAGGGKK